MTTALQLWSQHQTALIVGAGLLLMVVLLVVWMRKLRRNTEAKVVERAQSGWTRGMRQAAQRKPPAKASAPGEGKVERGAGRPLPQGQVDPGSQALLDKAAHAVAPQVLGTAKTLPSTVVPSTALVSPAREHGPSTASTVVPAAAPLPPPSPSGRAANGLPGEAMPAGGSLPGDRATSAEVQFSLDGDSGPVYSPPPIVEELPVASTRHTRDTPRVPTVVSGSSIGAYRMVRPTEPDVFTPPPSTTPTPGARTNGEQTPGPRRSLSLSAKAPRNEPGSSSRTPVPATDTRSDDVSLPEALSRASRITAGGTILGIGPSKPSK